MPIQEKLAEKGNFYLRTGARHKVRTWIMNINLNSNSAEPK